MPAFVPALGLASRPLRVSQSLPRLFSAFPPPPLRFCPTPWGSHRHLLQSPGLFFTSQSPRGTRRGLWGKGLVSVPRHPGFPRYPLFWLPVLRRGGFFKCKRNVRGFFPRPLSTCRPRGRTTIPRAAVRPRVLRSASGPEVFVCRGKDGAASANGGGGNE